MSAHDKSSVRNKLKLKTYEHRSNIAKNSSKAGTDLLSQALDIKNLRLKSSHLLGAGAAAAALTLANPVNAQGLLPPPKEIIDKVKFGSNVVPLISPQKVLFESLANVMPEKVRPLNREEEKTLEQIFKETIGIDAKATLEGEHLNTTYGLIGLEQHLKRYPGDTLSSQAESTESAMLEEGMAPGLGAWGYFAPSKSQLTDDLVETEKWYAVVQTLYLPDWNTRTRYLRDWYKHRKVLIVNTDNGQAVVAAIADSGPAAWTGKSFGGSPEVMNALGGPRYTKGPVVIFFVDDPDNTIPLGPVEYNKINVPEWAFQPI